MKRGTNFATQAAPAWTACPEVMIERAGTTGISSRNVDDLVRAVGVDSGISKPTVSRICADIAIEVDAFRKRPLDTFRSSMCGWTPPIKRLT